MLELPQVPTIECKNKKNKYYKNINILKKAQPHFGGYFIWYTEYNLERLREREGD